MYMDKEPLIKCLGAKKRYKLILKRFLRAIHLLKQQQLILKCAVLTSVNKFRIKSQSEYNSWTTFCLLSIAK